MLKKLYTSVPAEFAACIHPDCPQAASCLRHVAYQSLLEESPTFRVVNPGHCNPAGECRHFRSAKPVRYARGFIGFQENMTPKQWCRFKSQLLQMYGRSTFYMRRKGTVALSPKEQSAILEALHKAGITEDFEFDAYVEACNWFD